MARRAENEFTIKAGDTRPSLVATLRNPDGSSPDLTGATVALVYRRQDCPGAPVERAMTVVSALGARVQYDWVAADTATAGRYRAEIEVTFADANVTTYPNGDYIRLTIYDELNP